MAVKRKDDKHKRPSNNPMGNYASICQYNVTDIYAEVESNIDIEDYDGIVSYLLKQPYSKVKFMVDKSKDLPIIVKTIASALLKDIQYGRIQTTQMALERLKGKPVERQIIATTTESPLLIEVTNPADDEELTKLLEVK